MLDRPSDQSAKRCAQGRWALPGGFVDENETLDSAAARELQEETSVDPRDVLLTQVGSGQCFANWSESRSINRQI